MKKIVSIVGNPKLQSKTSLVAKEISRQFKEKNDLVDMGLLELAPIGACLFEWGNQEVQIYVEKIIQSDVIIVASPTYKAAYTGLLKAFLDQIPQEGLKGKTVLPVMMGAAPHHKMAVDVFLTPLLLELGANCPLRGLYVMESDMENVPAIISAWLDHAAI
ncbi:NAD(P)H-dependent oxidoreductase [Siminovitchia sediminis]|uniref:NAD(P)H-dependent oxidoreductase n=1 Tax=Siminovitchia sediminis TaxID=1274353 RepID=A0ABW4KNQ9_9BACI